MAYEIGAGELADEVGVPVRTIQFWTDAGVLKALPGTDRKGRGRHRLYNAAPPFFGERACALIAAEMHRFRVPVGVMRSIIDLLIRSEKPPEPERAHVVGVALAGLTIQMIISLQNSEGSLDDENLHITVAGEKIDPSIKSGYLLNLTHILKPLRA